MKFETVKTLDDEKFRRLTGVKRPTFDKKVLLTFQPNRRNLQSGADAMNFERGLMYANRNFFRPDDGIVWVKIFTNRCQEENGFSEIKISHCFMF